MILLSRLTERQARAYGLMSDEQYAREIRLQKQFYAAQAIMLSAIDDLNAGSSVVQVDREAFTNLVHDEMPSREFWDAELEEARYG